MSRAFTRRAIAVGGLAGLGLVACAPLRRAGPPVLVNLSDLGPEADGAESDQIASEWDLAQRMTVPVYVNGQGPHQFVVDTGANHSVVAAELAEPLNLPDAGTAQVHGIAGVEPARTVMINRLQVGQVVSRRVKAPLLPGARLGVSGLLGVDVLKNRRVTLDFRANELRIEPSGGRGAPKAVLGARSSRIVDAAHDPSVVTVPARYRFGQLIIIDADVGGHPVTAFLDSGSQNTVGNMALQRLVGALPEYAAQAVEVQMVSATGQTASGRLSPLPILRLGGLRIGKVSAVFADLHVFDVWDLKEQPALLLGIDVMRHFHSIELDFGRRVVVFRTPSSAPRLPAELAR